MTRTIFIAAALALAAVLPAIPAQATLLTRTFVSSTGSNSNPCTITEPCASFATAYALTAPSGIIAALDPGKYGPLTITGPVTINGYGWAAITGPASGVAITINANSGDKIALIGLEIDGAGAAFNGIQFNSGSSLNVQNSVIQNFGTNGIFFAPTALSPSQLFVSNTVVSDNLNGIDIDITGTGGAVIAVIDHVKMQNNTADGLTVSAVSGAGVSISDSVIAKNGGDGIATSCSGAATGVMVRNSTIAFNTHNGLSADGAANCNVRVTRSTITGNGTGWFIDLSGAAVLSYGDNNIDGNTNANTEPTPVLTYK